MTVKNTDIPPPILLNSDDSLIESGNYNINDMTPEDSDFPVFIIQFTEDNRILLDSANTGGYVDNGSKYFVFNNINIRLKPNGIDKLIYNYYYNPDDQTMSFTLTEEAASKSIEQTTDKLTKWVENETPNQIGDAIASILFNNTFLQQKIHNFLVQAIAGNLPGFNTEVMANVLARVFVNSSFVNDGETEEDIAQLLIPILNNIQDIESHQIAENITDALSGKLKDVFTEERVSHIISFLLYKEAWNNFKIANNFQEATIIIRHE